MVLGRWLNNVNKVLTVQAWGPEIRVNPSQTHTYIHTKHTNKLLSAECFCL